MNKPVCKLIGTTGNVFGLIGLVRKTLTDAGQPEKAKEFTDKAFEQSTYGDVLVLIGEYVQVR